jgi:hypothetical protein
VELVGLVEVRMRLLLLAVVLARLGLPGAGVREGPVGLGKSSLGVRVRARTGWSRSWSGVLES